MKSLNKKKTKELDWEKIIDYNCPSFIHANGTEFVGKKEVIKLLTQQRTELLEEILGLIHKDYKEFYFKSVTGKVKTDCSWAVNDELKKIREKLLNLLNKKDE